MSEAHFVFAGSFWLYVVPVWLARALLNTGMRIALEGAREERAHLRVAALELGHVYLHLWLACYFPLQHAGLLDMLWFAMDSEAGWCAAVVLMACLDGDPVRRVWASGALEQCETHRLLVAAAIFLHLRWLMTRDVRLLARMAADKGE